MYSLFELNRSYHYQSLIFAFFEYIFQILLLINLFDKKSYEDTLYFRFTIIVFIFTVFRRPTNFRKLFVNFVNIPVYPHTTLTWKGTPSKRQAERVYEGQHWPGVSVSTMRQSSLSSSEGFLHFSSTARVSKVSWKDNQGLVQAYAQAYLMANFIMIQASQIEQKQ